MVPPSELDKLKQVKASLGLSKRGIVKNEKDVVGMLVGDVGLLVGDVGEIGVGDVVGDWWVMWGRSVLGRG